MQDHGNIANNKGMYASFAKASGKGKAPLKIVNMNGVVVHKSKPKKEKSRLDVVNAWLQSGGQVEAMVDPKDPFAEPIYILVD